MAEVTINENVLFEADGILWDQAWSVIVRGTAEQLQTSAERELGEGSEVG